MPPSPTGCRRNRWPGSRAGAWVVSTATTVRRIGSGPRRNERWTRRWDSDWINAKIPFVRREAVRALRASYPTQDVALAGIDRTMRETYNAQLPHTFEEADLRQAIGVVQAIYRRNVFPTMKVGWGTYADQLGHMTSPGCFRCHDDAHKTRDGLAIRQDCEQCHTVE